MIPVSTFNVLLAVDILFILYSVIDHENRLYSNIVTAFLAGLLSAYMYVMISTEMVYDELIGEVHFVTSPSAGFFFVMLSMIMFGYTLFMVYEVIDIALQKKTMEQEATEAPPLEGS